MLLAAFVSVNAFLFNSNGIVTTVDSLRYLDYARALSNAFVFDPHNFWYVGYAAYLLVCESLTSNHYLVVGGQYLLSVIGVLSLYEAAIILWGSRSAALTAGLAMIIFIDIQLWNSYVLAESLYVSFVCFSVYLMVQAYKRRTANRITFALGVIVILFTCFIKPTGIALLATVVVACLYKLRSIVGSKPAYVGLIVIVAIGLFFTANRMLATFNVIENYEAGEVIHAVSKVSDQYEVNGLLINTPEKTYHPDPSLPPLIRIFLFAVHHPLFWSKLFFAKAFYLFAHIRPYWSWLHNAYALLFLIPVYAMAVAGISRLRHDMPLVTCVICYLAMQTLSVCMTSADWDGRFLLPMLPVIFLMASPAPVMIWGWLVARISSGRS